MNKTLVVRLSVVALGLSFLIPLIRAREVWPKEISLQALDYKIDFFLDFEGGRLSAVCDFAVQNTSRQAVREIPMLLYKEFHVSSIQDGTGGDISFTQELIPFEDWDKLSVNFVVASPTDPLPPGEKLVLHIEYEGTLSGYEETGMKYVKDHIDKEFTFIREECKTYPIVTWPTLNSMRTAIIHSRFSYLINVDVPAGLVAANGGILVGTKESDGRMIYTYRNSRPAWRIDIAVADYGLLKDDVGHFQVFYFRNNAAGASAILESMEKTVDLLTKRLGQLLDKDSVVLSVIEIPMGYGPQNDTTCITLDEAAFRTGGAVGGLYHEISHWWNVRPLDEVPCRMESEGFAVFMQGWIESELDGKSMSLEERYYRISENFRNQVLANPKLKSIPVIDYGKEMMTNLSYGRGSLLFILLFDLLGEREFFDILGKFYRAFHSLGATTDDFVNFIIKNAAFDLNSFFDEWVYGIESNRYIMKHIPYQEVIRFYRH